MQQMEETGTGYIMPIKEAVHSLKREGHPDQDDFRFIRPSSEKDRVGKMPSKHFMLTLDKINPGGGVEEHYHEYTADMPIFDHVYYVISGKILAKIGAEERVVGANSLIYCPSNVRHSIKNVGKTVAQVLRMSGSAEGKKMGGPVYSKKPSGQLGVREWKLADSKPEKACTDKSCKHCSK
jgi:mannose-6-phosphate isomerase-like protein (cupin superfamily)